MTPKENFRKFFQHERGEWFPSFFTDANLSVFITGMDERAPHNQSGKDFFGCTWVYDPVGNAAVPDTSVLPVLDDICDWREKVVFPDLDAVDWEASAKADKVDQYDPDKFNYSMLLEGPFERLHTLMGFENALCAMLTDPEEVSAFFDRLTEMKCRELDILKKYYLTEAVCFHDDWGTQKNMFFSPDIWRSLIKPQIKNRSPLSLSRHVLRYAFLRQNGSDHSGVPGDRHRFLPGTGHQRHCGGNEKDRQKPVL